MYTLSSVTAALFELVNPTRGRRDALITRVLWEEKEAVRTFARDQGLSLSDAQRKLLRDGLKANGY